MAQSQFTDDLEELKELRTTLYWGEFNLPPINLLNVPILDKGNFYERDN